MSPNMQEISPASEIIAEIKAGRIVILVDEEDRENEGDFVMAAERVTPEAINFMIRHGRGLVCLTLTEARCRQLGLMQMARDNKSSFNTAFTVSIEAASGVTTGISAADRARTIQTAVARNARPEDLVQPGHIFPIQAREGGVLVRAGHTEAGCDLAALAGLEPAAVLCEILKDDGSMARLPDLIVLAKQHGLKVGTVSDLIQYRAASESLIERVFSKPVTTGLGSFMLHAFKDLSSGATHLALTKGDIGPETETLVRVHGPLSIVDFFDDGERRQAFSLNEAQAAIEHAGCGVIVLMCQDENCSNLSARLLGTGEPAEPKWDPRIHGIGAQILRNLGVRRMRLMSRQRKFPSMVGFDLEICSTVASPADL